MENREEELKPGLAERIRAGDHQAETELIEQYSRGVMAMLRQRTADWELAADVHQDTFVVVLKRLRSSELDHPDRLSAFVRQTAINIHLAMLRKHRRRNTEPDSDTIAAAADASAGPVSIMESSERRAMLVHFIGELTTDRDRQLLRRFYLSDEPKSEICRDLGLDSTHFDRVLYRARERLRLLVQQNIASSSTSTEAKV